MAGWDDAPYPTLDGYDGWKTRTDLDDAEQSRRQYRSAARPPIETTPPTGPDDPDISF